MWESTLAKDLPAGKYPGQFFHPAGTKVALAVGLETVRFGHTSFIAPNPVFFYFNHAEKQLTHIYDFLVKIEASRKHILLGTQHVQQLDSDLVYEYMENIMAFIVFLYSGIEAFANQKIPNLKMYPADPKGKRKNPYHSKVHFERSATTEYKLILIAQNVGKKKITKQKFWSYFLKLTEIRHSIIHLKMQESQFQDLYNDIYINLLDFDTNDHFLAAKNLCEYIQSDFFA